jgi:hypothetical protein
MPMSSPPLPPSLLRLSRKRARAAMRASTARPPTTTAGGGGRGGAQGFGEGGGSVGWAGRASRRGARTSS